MTETDMDDIKSNDFQSSLEKVSIKGTDYPDNPNLAPQQVELERLKD